MKLIRRTPGLNTWTPNTFESFVEKFFNDSTETSTENYAFVPKADIAETEKEFEITLAVPGMKKADFKINIEEGRLVISGERKLSKEENGKNFHTLQTQYGTFTRSFYLPDNVLQNDVSAAYEDGLLILTVPKDEKKQIKHVIDVK